MENWIEKRLGIGIRTRVEYRHASGSHYRSEDKDLQVNAQARSVKNGSPKTRERLGRAVLSLVGVQEPHLFGVQALPGDAAAGAAGP